MLLKDHIDIISEPNEFAHSIKDVVIPIRNSMKMIHNKFDVTFAVECQRDSTCCFDISQLVMHKFRNRQVLGNTKRRHTKPCCLPIFH